MYFYISFVEENTVVSNVGVIKAQNILFMVLFSQLIHNALRPLPH